MVRIGGLVALLCALWCVSGSLFLIVNGTPDSESPGWQSVLASGLAVGSVGFIVGAVVAGIGDHREKEKRRNADLHRGAATLTNLRPGDLNAERGTQNLLCRLEIVAPGVETIEGDYRAALGPLDALRVAEGASFPCEASPSYPERVRVWITEERHLDFNRS